MAGMNGGRCGSWWPLFAAAMFAAAITGAVFACDTPVYRYAMYRWHPAPYELFYFHDGAAEGPQVADIRAAVKAAAEDATQPANLEFHSVDVSDESALENLPADVRARARELKSLPTFLLVNPIGMQVFQGDVTAGDIPKVMHSPQRQAIGKGLASTHAGVYLLVTSDDEELNQAAEAAVAKLVEEVNSGKLDLTVKPASPAGADDEAPPAEEKAAEAKPAPSVTSIVVGREKLRQEDPWLEQMLMSVEGDLAPLAKEPMLFIVYGRGRVLPPYVGKGITYENVAESAEFISGACSCTVKDQNPGVDLLMAFDWESAAVALKEKFGTEEGNEGRLADLFPQLDVPSTPAVGEPLADAGAGENSSTPEPSTPSETAGDTTDSTSEASGEPKEESAVAPAAETGDVDSSSESSPADASDGEATEEEAAAMEEQLPGRQVAPVEEIGPNVMVMLGVGMAIGLVVLFAATFLILKPQH